MKIYKVKVDGVSIHTVFLPENLEVLRKGFQVEVEEVEGRVEERKDIYEQLREAIKRGETIAYADKEYVVFAKGPHPCIFTQEGYSVHLTGEETLRELISSVECGIECIVEVCNLLSIEFTGYEVTPESLKGMDFGNGIILSVHSSKKGKLWIDTLVPESLNGSEVMFLTEEIESVLDELEEDEYLRMELLLEGVKKGTYVSIWI